MAKSLRDGDDVISLIEKDTSGFLQPPDEKAIKKVLFRDGVALVHHLETGTLVAGAVLYDRGKLPSGRRLFEFGSVRVEEPVQGFKLMKMMAAALILPRIIYDGSPGDYAVDIMSVVPLNPKPNHASLKQIPRCGFNEIDQRDAAHLLALRPVGPGRKLFVYDPHRSCELAQFLLEIALEPNLINSADSSRRLHLDLELSLVDDGVLERFLVNQCPAVAA